MILLNGKFSGSIGIFALAMTKHLIMFTEVLVLVGQEHTAAEAII